MKAFVDRLLKRWSSVRANLLRFKRLFIATFDISITIYRNQGGLVCLLIAMKKESAARCAMVSK